MAEGIDAGGANETVREKAFRNYLVGKVVVNCSHYNIIIYCALAIRTISIVVYSNCSGCRGCYIMNTKHWYGCLEIRSSPAPRSIFIK